MRNRAIYRLLLAITTALALVVVVLGAYVRLSDAGLGCPDWPGCYGQISVAAAQSRADAISRHYPHNPLQPEKAFKEMLHRYAAGSLGLLVLVVAWLAWREQRRRGFALILGCLILFQALLGMWTVTMQLQPLVVTAHLAGGMTVLALLWWLLLNSRPSVLSGQSPIPSLRIFAAVGLLLLTLQILLGGWTSANYAGMACGGFPSCNGQWWPDADYVSGFGVNVVDGAGLVAIQMVHRLGALSVLLYLGALALSCLRRGDAVRPIGLLLGLLLLLQVAIGVGNVLTGLPLPLAAAHNAGAAMLLLALLTLNYRLTQLSAGETRKEAL